MKLTFLRGACVVIETEDCRILCDPWLYDGIYYGAWGHYPEFTEWDHPALRNIDYIYVSHIHPDHFDRRTMRKLASSWIDLPPVIIHKYPTSFLRRQIEDLGFQVLELEHGGSVLKRHTIIRIFSADGCDPQACGSFYGCTMPGVLNTQLDSLAVIQDREHTIVNVNDCPLQLSRGVCEKIAAEYPSIDLALVAYAGASPYPHCFEMLEEEKQIEAYVKRREFIDGVAGFSKALDARRVFPFAGDYQLCGSLSRLNEVRGVPEVADVHMQLNMAGISTLYLAPGETTDIGDDAEPVGMPRKVDRLSYVRNVLSQRRLDFDDGFPPAEIPTYLFNEAFNRFDAKRREYGLQCTMSAYIKDIEGYFKIPPNQPWVHVDRIDRSEPFVALSTDMRLLVKLLQGPHQAHWNNAQIGSHIWFERQPLRHYEPGFYHLLSYLHS